MKKFNALSPGITLVELMVSVVILFLFMGMVAWLAKGSADHRMRSERRLKLANQLQRNMFLIENDLLSARRHTLGNVLCNNITFPHTGGLWRTTSDPGFDVNHTSLSNTDLRTQWYSAPLPLIPAGVGAAIHADAYIDRSPGGRLHGTGSLAIRSSLPDPQFYTVRSPDFDGLRGDENYVLAGWVKGDADGLGGFLTPEIVVQRSAGDGSPGSDIFVTATVPRIPLANFTAWNYVTLPISVSAVEAAFTHNIYLRATRAGATTRVLTAYFDDITLTPAVNIAQINFTAAGAGSLDPNVNLNNRTDLGMIFFQTNPLTGSLQEMKYIFADGNQRTFPVVVPDLLRFSMPVPYMHPTLGVQWHEWVPPPGFPPPPPPRPEAPLTNIDSLSVSWDGPVSSGTYRPIRVTTTVRDRDNATRTLTLSRTLYPPTD